MHPLRRTSPCLATVVLCLAACASDPTGSGSASVPDPSSPSSAAPDASQHRRPWRDRPPAEDPSADDPSRLRRGTYGWRLRRPVTAGQIEGYIDRPGAPPGTVIGVRVSTQDPSFRVAAFRIGAYAGGTGHLVWRSRALPGTRQAAPRFSHPATRTVVAGWRDSVRVDTDGWEPGAYLFRFTSSTGWQAAAPYVVTSPSVEGRVVLVVPVTTWQAYNHWGGYGLYEGPPGDRRAWRVSFDRPYHGPGLGELGFTVAHVAVQAETTGAPLAYLTNLDLDADPHALDGAAGYVSVGHDEYWTPAMRSAVERARGRGTNLAFFAANSMYWRVRVTDGPPGRAGDVIGYRSDAVLDPWPVPAERTSRWRDAPAADPEQGLVGMSYECFPVDAAYQVVTPRWWGFRGTRVRLGSSFPHLVGNEADRVYPVTGTPRPLQVLSHVAYSCGGVPTSGQSTYYVHRSGAGVVATGTLRWTCALTGNCFGLRLEPRTVRFVQQVTRTIITAFARGPVGERHPAHDNVRAFDLPLVNQVPAS
jgi:hypothetical protein